MNALERRLQQLEQESADRSQIVWIEAGESREDALRRVRPLTADESPVFVGWRGFDVG